LENELIVEGNTDVDFLIANTFGDVMTNMLESTNYYTIDVMENCKSIKTTILIILIISSIIILGSVFVIFPLILSVRKGKIKPMNYLLQIPIKSIKFLYKKTERYLASADVLKIINLIFSGKK
jgi:hypothetical protein